MLEITPVKPRMAGLFDLPLELRQQIWRECLPRTQLNEPLAWFTDYYSDDWDDLSALRKSDPRIMLELQNEERTYCKVLRFKVSATRKWQPPPATAEYHNLKDLNIEYAQYPYEEPIHSDECNCSFDQAIQSRREKYLATMFWNLKDFVAWFTQAHNGPPLENLNIEFAGAKWDEEGYQIPDPRWCKFHYDAHGCEIGVSLATREAKGTTVTVLESLLKPLATLPPAEEASAPEVAISLDCELLPQGIRTHFNGTYQICLTWTWESWLAGERDVGIRKLFLQRLGRGCWCRGYGYRNKAECKRCLGKGRIEL